VEPDKLAEGHEVNRVRTVSSYAYWIAAVFMVLFIPSNIYQRGDDSFRWVLPAFRHDARVGGTGAGIVTLVMYVVFYSALFAIPYRLLAEWWQPVSTPAVQRRNRQIRAFVGLWVVASWFFVTPSVFAFVRALKYAGWGWLPAISWVGWSGIVVYLVWVALGDRVALYTVHDVYSLPGYEKERAELRRQTRGPSMTMSLANLPPGTERGSVLRVPLVRWAAPDWENATIQSDERTDTANGEPERI
jgi:hypothetical protein